MGGLRPRRSLLLLLLAAMVAGCTAAPSALPSPEEPEGPAPRPEAASGPADDAPEGPPPRRAPGHLAVAVRDTAGNGLAGATVRAEAEGRVVAADDRGVAHLPNVTAGRVQLLVGAEGHRGARVSVLVRPHADTTADVTLPPLDGLATPVEETPTRVRYLLEGHYDCTATYLIVTGDCFLLADSVAVGRGSPRRATRRRSGSSSRSPWTRAGRRWRRR